jgi:hypothetical protein
MNGDDWWTWFWVLWTWFWVLWLLTLVASGNQ